MANCYAIGRGWFGLENLKAYARAHTPAGAASIAWQLRLRARHASTDIFLQWSILRSILQTHEARIHTRWMNKTKKQRKGLLLQAWPDIPANHHPEFDIFRKNGNFLDCAGNWQETLRENWLDGNSKTSIPFKWPYVNLEDLVQGRCLALFINSRGRYPPHTFVHADLQASDFGFEAVQLLPELLERHTMFLSGNTPSTYGAIISWADFPGASKLLDAGIGFDPGEGLMVLQIQQRTLKFLITCCRLILHDYHICTSEALPTLPEPVFTEIGTRLNLETLNIESQYQHPGGVNFVHLTAVLEARCASAEDHVHMLREDPGYFHDTLGDWFEHSPERILDSEGKIDPIVDTDMYWKGLLSHFLFNSYFPIQEWKMVHHYLLNLATLDKRYGGSISPGTQLPEEFLKGLLMLRSSLVVVTRRLKYLLQFQFGGSPPLRTLYLRRSLAPGSERMLQTYKGDHNDYLMSLLHEISNTSGGGVASVCSLPDVIEEFERFLSQNSAEKERISGHVERILSDLGIIAHIRRQLRRVQPCRESVLKYYHLSQYHEQMKEEVSTKVGDNLSQLQSLSQLGVQSHGPDWKTLAKPTREKFYYPYGKVSKHSTDLMRKAEKNLDLFWTSVDQYYFQRHKQSIQTSLGLTPRELKRTPKWVEPAKEKPKTIARSFGGIGDIGGLYAHLSQFNNSKDQPDIEAFQTKVKAKTRGQATPILEQVEQTTAQDGCVETNSGSKQIFTLKPAAFKVFSTLFFVPSTADHPGEMSWDKFLAAMDEVGFQSQKLHGSIWQFTPTNLDVERSIQFHEPHPKSKIPFLMARRIGRRLNRAYGWTSDTFVLRK